MMILIQNQINNWILFQKMINIFHIKIVIRMIEVIEFLFLQKIIKVKSNK
jgi:hypothetical protein